MMCVIWKYPIEWGLNKVEMPEGSTVLPTVLVQGRQIVIYALVNPDKPATIRLIMVQSTGSPFKLPVNCRYLGTFQVGGDVGHVFELFD